MRALLLSRRIIKRQIQFWRVKDTIIIVFISFLKVMISCQNRKKYQKEKKIIDLQVYVYLIEKEITNRYGN